jgi:hypothetical protein
LLLVRGFGVAFAPASVPGLTVPGSPQAMHSMQEMEGSMNGGAMDGGSEMNSMPRP